MHNPKPRGGTLEVSRSGRRTDPNHASSQSPATRTPKAKSAKAVDRRSPRNPASEKKRPGKASELETRVVELQEELKKAKNQLAAMSTKLTETQRELDELWASDESRVQELRKISQDRDRAWESELKAVQNHRAMDSAALAAATNEIQKLKSRLEKAAESEASQAKHAESAREEIRTLRVELSETLDLVEELRTQLNQCKDSEDRALKMATFTDDSLATELAEDLNAKLLEKEAELQRVSEENEYLKGKLESAAEKDDLGEMEAELKRVKVQAEQWRKAAEAAAAIVLGDSENRKFVELTESPGEKASSTDEVEDESPMKKNSNMLRKLGVLLKKGPK